MRYGKVQKFLKELPDHNEANENGDTLLHAFVRRRDKYSQDCLLALLVYGQCDVDGGNHQGFTPLHIAAELNDLPAAKALVAFGCEVNSLNPDDETPLDIARRCYPDGDIVTLLVSVGGQTAHDQPHPFHGAEQRVRSSRVHTRVCGDLCTADLCDLKI
ncbi:85/88 kDa calcium-independent phospholipase A2 [Geodia barretti]|uniref:85/88 kDa calcium-independent phospholipase A2 n=1 Tax=Geodia barretti TaxID=519541 RepID=A0AA35SJQ7_GEOBA|nr:85/88 kDa calcium-independent phospholipase A2 [Geodia barretti]